MQAYKYLYIYYYSDILLQYAHRADADSTKCWRGTQRGERIETTEASREINDRMDKCRRVMEQKEGGGV